MGGGRGTATQASSRKQFSTENLKNQQY